MVSTTMRAHWSEGNQMFMPTYSNIKAQSEQQQKVDLPNRELIAGPESPSA